MSNLETFAREELRRAGWFDKDGMYDGMLGEAVMKLIKAFDDEGHSGGSASMTISAFQKVANFEPLTPLTGDDDEWIEVTDNLWQNKRCPHVFKDENGAYDSEGRIFREPDGACFVGKDSRVPVTFPYVPKREYVDVEPSRAH